MKRTLIFLLKLVLVNSVFAQSGRVFESLVFESEKVSYPVEYSIYLPPDYEASHRNYPVIYLLHGYSDDETGWIQYGEVKSIADRGISNEDLSSCIIVIPDGKVGWFVNSYDGTNPWEDMFIQEFIPFIETEYRIRKRKNFRAIAGLSMGGNGALLLSMRHPELFSSCVALSAATFTDDEILNNNVYENYFGNVFGPKPARGEVSDFWKSHSPLHLLDRIDKEKLRSVRFYIDCGDDDFVYKGNSALHLKMRELDIPHEYRVRDGGHTWSYWRSGLLDGLLFLAEKFHL